MPITLRWVDQDAILLMECTGRLDESEVEAIMEPILDHLDQAERPVHLISDWRTAENFPVRYSAIPTTARLFKHANMGMWAIIGLNSNLAFWAEILSKVGGMRYRGFTTPEDAAQFLRELDKVQQQR